jgi:hypothetical protein
MLLKGLGHEIFYFWMFHELSSPKPMIIQEAQFRHSQLQVRLRAGVVDTGGALELRMA